MTPFLAYKHHSKTLIMIMISWKPSFMRICMTKISSFTISIRNKQKIFCVFFVILLNRNRVMCFINLNSSIFSFIIQSSGIEISLTAEEKYHWSEMIFQDGLISVWKSVMVKSWKIRDLALNFYSSFSISSNWFAVQF